MFLMDRFFEGAFFTFGLEVIAFAERDQEDRLDPMVYIFPRMTKCTFHKFGTSGEVKKHDLLISITYLMIIVLKFISSNIDLICIRELEIVIFYFLYNFLTFSFINIQFGFSYLIFSTLQVVI